MIEGLIVVAIGAVNAGIGYKLATDAAFREEYIKKSPKAWLWRKLFGEERAIKLLHRVFAPLACVIGIALIALGGFLLLAA